MVSRTLVVILGRHSEMTSHTNGCFQQIFQSWMVRIMGIHVNRWKLFSVIKIFEILWRMEWHQLEKILWMNKRLSIKIWRRKIINLFIIHQCVDPDNFEKVGNSDLVTEAWDILEKSFRGIENVKDARFQTHKRSMNCFRWKKVKAPLISSLG